MLADDGLQAVREAPALCELGSELAMIRVESLLLDPLGQRDAIPPGLGLVEPFRMRDVQLPAVPQQRRDVPKERSPEPGCSQSSS